MHLVFIPGLVCDHAVWQHQAAVLGARTAVDIADHGGSDSIEGMAQLVLDHAPARFAMAAHSMGGRVAFEVMRRSPERVAGLAVLDTGYRPRPPGLAGELEQRGRYALLEKARTEGMRAMGLEWVQRMVHPDRLSDARLIESILQMIARKTPDVFAAQIRALLARPDAEPVLSQIRCPVLVLCGRGDAWSPLAQHEEMAALIPASRLAVIEDCGHMSTMERPEAVTAALTKWLESL